MPNLITLKVQVHSWRYAYTGKIQSKYKNTDHSEAAGEIRTEHARLKCLHVATDIGFCVQQVTVVCEFVVLGLMFVWVDDVGVESLHHE